MKHLFILSLAILFFNLSFAQKAHNANQNNKKTPEGVVTGYVLEKKNGSPIEFANIVIYSKKDSSIVSGGITNKNGYFRIDKIKYGKFFVEINFIGYGKHIIPEILIKPDNKELNLGKINLAINAEMLNEINIEANVNHVDYRLDRKVVNVNQDIISAGASAVEVLENVPSIETDMDGNVSLRGTESFLVLVDGRPSPIQGSEALQQIPANTIESIEIITNPSAKYEADGVGGIINVVLKKDKRQGYNGQISANYGTYNSYGANALFNFRTEKINFFVGGEYGNRIFEGDGISNSETFLGGDTSFNLNNTSSNYHRRQSGSGRAGLDIYLNDNEIITISGRYGISGFGRGGDTWAESFYLAGENQFNQYYYLSDNSLLAQRSYFSGDINYMKKFKDPGHELQIYGSISGDAKDENSTYNEEVTDAEANPLGNIISEYRNIEIGNGKTLTGKADYVLPLFEQAKFEAGYQIKYSAEDNDYRLQTLSATEWIDDTTQLNPYTYSQNIQSGYLMFSNFWNKLGYQFGLRTEYTDRLFHQTSTDQKWQYDKFDFFPSVHLSYQLPADMQLLASYSRRLERPRGWYLDPFVKLIDPNNIRKGNPNLLPEYTNSFDLSLQKKFGANFISLEGYARQTNNKIERITQVYEPDPSIYLMSFDNIGEDLSIGGELMANLNLTSWYNLNLSGTVYYYEIISELYDSKNTITWRTRLNNTFRLKKSGTSIQVGAFYRGPSISAQSTREAMWMANIGVRQEFLDRKLSVSINVRNAFLTMKRETTTETANIYSYSLRQPKMPMFNISVTYKINDFKKRSDNGGEQIMEGADNGM
ncbi:MAG: outer membrane beta-barrel family protein [Bacteroidales bacterium]|nr:outer membrane beta-barrel family protein [Bacteroidales bacterium]